MNSVIDLNVSEITKLSKRKAELDLRLKNLSLKTVQSPYRLETNEMHILSTIIEQEKDISLRLLQISNEIELIRRLGKIGYFFINELHFRIIAMGRFTASFLSLLMITHFVSDQYRAYSFIASIVFGGTQALKSMKLKNAFESELPYKSKSLEPIIDQKINKAILHDTQEMTFKSAEELALMRSILNKMGCKTKIRIETDNAKPGTSTENRIRIGKNKSHIRISEFSDDPALIEHASELENQQTTHKTKTMNSH